MNIQYEIPIEKMDRILKDKIIKSTYKYISPVIIVLYVIIIMIMIFAISLVMGLIVNPTNSIESIKATIIIDAILSLMFIFILVHLYKYEMDSMKQIRIDGYNIDYNMYFNSYYEARNNTVIYKYQIKDLTKPRRNYYERINIIKNSFKIDIIPNAKDLLCMSKNEKGDISKTTINVDDVCENQYVFEPEIRVTENYEILLLLPHTS